MLRTNSTRVQKTERGRRKGGASKYSLRWLYWLGTSLTFGVLIWVVIMIILQAIDRGFK